MLRIRLPSQPEDGWGLAHVLEMIAAEVDNEIGRTKLPGRRAQLLEVVDHLLSAAAGSASLANGRR